MHYFHETTKSKLFIFIPFQNWKTYFQTNITCVQDRNLPANISLVMYQYRSIYYEAIYKIGVHRKFTGENVIDKVNNIKMYGVCVGGGGGSGHWTNHLLTYPRSRLGITAFLIVGCKPIYLCKPRPFPHFYKQDVEGRFNFTLNHCLTLLFC